MSKIKDYFIDQEIRRAWEESARADRAVLVIAIVAAIAAVVFLNPGPAPVCDMWCRSFP